MSKKIMNERQFSGLIYRIVNESLDALSGYNFESNDNTNDNNAQNDDSKRRNSRRRQQVEAFFKQPGVNPAAYAYRLYRVKPVEGDDTNDMKNARSKFMKCLNHEKNEEGYEYAFDSSEVNTLFSMISGNELKENKISLSESDIMYMVNESMKKVLKENEYSECGVWDILDELKQYMSSDDILACLIGRLAPLQARDFLNDIKRTELGDVIDDENIFETKNKRKKQPKTGTIEWGNDRVEATEDGVDKYGNPMYKVKNAPSKAGRKCKDGSRRVQAFDFLPYKD